jgi:penicillin-binding protein 1C
MPDGLPWLMAASGSGRVGTTIDNALQKRVSTLAVRHGRRLESFGIGSLAVVVVRVADGSVAAYIGNVPAALSGGDAGQRNWVDCASAPRSSGSILKPFLYAAMVDSGELTPSRLVPDIPTRVGSYSPENNLMTYAGAVRADVALARSLNVPFVRLLRDFGVERFAALLGRMGFSTLTRAPADYGLTLILGGAEVTLIDAASAYAALARMARTASGHGSITHREAGNPFIGAYWRADVEGGTKPYDPPFSPGAAWLTLQALVDVARPGEEASWQEYASSRRVAWKTGTSFGSRDAWAVGVSPDHVVAVWAGNADGTGRPELKGSQAAAPLLFDVFENLPRSAWFAQPPDGLRYETVCADSGFAAGPDCARTERVLVPAGSNTDKTCPYCTVVHLSEDGRYRVRAESAGSLGLRSERRFVLPPAIEWYYSRSTIGYKPLPPWAPGASGEATGDIEFIAPEEGSAILVPIELDGSPGKAVFRAASRNAGTRLFWHLDGDYLGETVGDHRMEARPAPGRHELVVVSEDGASASRRFEVYPRE